MQGAARVCFESISIRLVVSPSGLPHLHVSRSEGDGSSGCVGLGVARAPCVALRSANTRPTYHTQHSIAETGERGGGERGVRAMKRGKTDLSRWAPWKT
jgi:hypothetical protein